MENSVSVTEKPELQLYQETNTCRWFHTLRHFQVFCFNILICHIMFQSTTEHTFLNTSRQSRLFSDTTTLLVCGSTFYGVCTFLSVCCVVNA